MVAEKSTEQLADTEQVVTMPACVTTKALCDVAANARSASSGDAKMGRLNNEQRAAWSFNANDKAPWYQFSFTKPTRIFGIATKVSRVSSMTSCRVGLSTENFSRCQALSCCHAGTVQQGCAHVDDGIHD